MVIVLPQFPILYFALSFDKLKQQIKHVWKAILVLEIIESIQSPLSWFTWGEACKSTVSAIIYSTQHRHNAFLSPIGRRTEINLSVFWFLIQIMVSTLLVFSTSLDKSDCLWCSRNTYAAGCIIHRRAESTMRSEDLKALLAVTISHAPERRVIKEEMSFTMGTFGTQKWAQLHWSHLLRKNRFY